MTHGPNPADFPSSPPGRRALLRPVGLWIVLLLGGFGAPVSFAFGGDLSILENIRAQRDGRVPHLGEVELGALRAKVIADSESFAKELAAQIRASNDSCGKFNKVSMKMAKDIARTLPKFTGVQTDVNRRDEILAHARLQIAIPMFGQLQSLLAGDREGGYGFFDRHQKNTCAYADRETTKALFANLAGSYLAFQRSALGDPALMGLENLTERLLTLSLRDEVHSQRVSMWVQGLTFAAAWYSWAVLTASVRLTYGATGMARVLSFAPGGNGAFLATLFNNRAGIFAGQIGLWQLENYAYPWFAAQVNPEKVQRSADTRRLQVDFGSWSERIADADKLSSSGLDEPQLYLAFLSTLEADYGGSVLAWISAHQDAVKAEGERDPAVADEIQNVIWLAGEAAFVRGQVPEVVARQMPEWIAKKFNVKVTCGVGQPLGPSPLQCLIGERRVARALYSGALRPPEDNVTKLTSLNLTTHKQYAVKSQEIGVRFDLPYKQPPARVAAFVSEAYGSREVRAKIKFQKQFDEGSAAWALAGRIPIEFDPGLGPADQWNAISVLTQIAQREPGLLNRPGELLYFTKPLIATGYRTLFEARLKLQENLPATATYDQMVQFLRAAQDPQVVTPVKEQLAETKAALAKVTASIKAKWGVESRCSDFGNLRLFRCLSTLKRIEQIATAYPKVHTDAEYLMITGQGEIGEGFEKVQSPDDPNVSIWAVRDTFRVLDMVGFLKNSGWVGEN